MRNTCKSPGTVIRRYDWTPYRGSGVKKLSVSRGGGKEPGNTPAHEMMVRVMVSQGLNLERGTGGLYFFTCATRGPRKMPGGITFKHHGQGYRLTTVEKAIEMGWAVAETFDEQWRPVTVVPAPGHEPLPGTRH